MSLEATEHVERSLADRRIALVGKLFGMSRREAEQLIHDRGGQVVPRIDADTQLVVVNDDTRDIGKLVDDEGVFDDADSRSLA